MPVPVVMTVETGTEKPEPRAVARIGEQWRQRRGAGTRYVSLAKVVNKDTQTIVSADQTGQDATE